MDNLEQTFNEIVAKYRERLYWHIRSLVCSHEDADDVLQDCFVKIWKALPGFRGDAELFTWAWRIATNEALNFLHKQKVRAALSFESLRTTLENRIDEDPWFDGDALQRDLAKAIVGLPEKQRLVFQMRYFEDLSYEQISEITGTSVGALKASYHIAYEKIREKLKLSSL
ncbi:MAG: RNA polymerase sigma factor [Bacteroidales bacterium]|nr:RNA polymerase sigma factor [Bacteroidales bacterium]